MPVLGGEQVPGPRGCCAWEGRSGKLLVLALGSGDDMRTLPWALFFKTPPEIACSLEQAEQKAGGSILVSIGAAKIQFHIYFLTPQSMEQVIISFEWLKSLYHQAFKRLDVQLHPLLSDIFFPKVQTFLWLVGSFLQWCPSEPLSSSFFFLLFFLVMEKGEKAQRAGSGGTARWMHHGLAELQGWAGGKDQDKAGVTSLVGKCRAVS